MTNTTHTILSLIAPAKLNLFLHINGRRTDGYHELETLFTFLDYGDELSFTVLDNAQIEITGDTAGIATTDNLIYKAAKLLQETAHINQGASIHVCKRLPMGGGVGGGSSDAATTLLALNQLWQINLSLEKLAELGLTLGADVPVFINGKTAIAQGVGEQLCEIDIPEKWYCVVHPGEHVSTATIFTHPELKRDTAKLPADWRTVDLHNDCEPLVKKLCPEVEKTLKWLLKYAPSKMTGTGACCFVAFSEQQDAQQVLDNLPEKWSGFVARSASLSPAHKALAAHFEHEVTYK